MNEDYLDYIDQLRRYHQSQNFEISPTKWAEIYPDGKEIVSELYLTREHRLAEIAEATRTELIRLSGENADRQLWGEAFLELGYGREAIELKKQINWLRRYLTYFVADKQLITDETISRAREVPLESLIPDLKLRSGKLIRCCPFHEEGTPSFTVFKDNHYYCFGCGAKGNPIDWVMKTQNLIFVEAVKYLLHL